MNADAMPVRSLSSTLGVAEARGAWAYDWSRPTAHVEDCTRGTPITNYNQQIIEEFRANGGKVEGNFAGRPLLLLSTTGAKSGAERTTPLMFLPEGDAWYVFASMGGAPSNPAWYHNLVAHPDATIEVGAERVPVRASVLDDRAKRDEVYARQTALYPTFADYETKTDRTIPVVRLTRA